VRGARRVQSSCSTVQWAYMQCGGVDVILSCELACCVNRAVCCACVCVWAALRQPHHSAPQKPLRYVLPTYLHTTLHGQLEYGTCQPLHEHPYKHLHKPNMNPPSLSFTAPLTAQVPCQLKPKPETKHTVSERDLSCPPPMFRLL